MRAERALRPPRVPVNEPPQPGAEDVTFPAADGVLLRGWFRQGDNRATIILAHGHGQNRTQLLPEAKLLAEAGFSFLSFDWRAHGASGGELVGWGSFEQKDLQGALDYLAGRDDVDPSRVGALGFSRGGALVIEVAARDSRLRAIVASAATTSLREGIQNDFGADALTTLVTRLVFSAHGIDVDGVKPIERIGAVSPRHVLIILGAADLSTPVTMGRRLASRAGAPGQYWEIPDAGHGGFATTAPLEYGPRLIQFFRTALLND